jgi:hypothetical protein
MLTLRNLRVNTVWEPPCPLTPLPLSLAIDWTDINDIANLT